MRAMGSGLKQWRGDRKVEEAAALIGVTAAMWSRWENERRAVPAGRVLEIEALTGISRHDIRPDVFGTREEQASAAKAERPAA